MHETIAEALEDLYGTETEAHLEPYHFAEAEPVPGPQKLVLYSLLAGEQALEACAWEEALTHFQRALAAKEGKPVDAETGAILFSLGRAQGAADQVHRTRCT